MKKLLFSLIATMFLTLTIHQVYAQEEKPTVPDTTKKEPGEKLPTVPEPELPMPVPEAPETPEVPEPETPTPEVPTPKTPKAPEIPSEEPLPPPPPPAPPLQE